MNHLTDETLNEYLDNELTNRSEAELHLSQCADCAARLTSLQALFAEIESLPELTLSKPLAAPFTRRDVGFALPTWLKLTATLQAVIALIVLIASAPFVMNLLPAIQTPSMTEVLLQLQSQWMAWLDVLLQTQMPVIPEYSFPFEISSLFLAFVTVGLLALWIVGNGLLLRNQITKRRTP